MHTDTFLHINHRRWSISHHILHLTLHMSLQPWRTSINKRNLSYFSKLFIIHKKIINTWLVSPSIEEAPYTSNKPHKKNRWYSQTYMTLQIHGNSKKQHHVAFTWEEISLCKLKGDLAVFPLFPADLPMKCFHFAPFGSSCSTGYN